MKYGVILAGGRSTRLGPLGAAGKGMVSVANKPHIIHQLQLLRTAGVDKVVIVASPATRQTLMNTVVWAGLQASFVTQKDPEGPVAAMQIGLSAIFHNMLDKNRLGNKTDASVIVLMADTYLNEKIPITHAKTMPWVATAPAPSTRPWAWFDTVNDEWVDVEATMGTPVTIGLYGFPSILGACADADTALRAHKGSGELGMAAFLNAMTVAPRVLTAHTWLDLGDLTALAKARTARFVTREAHEVASIGPGLVTKFGEGTAFNAQAGWMYERAESASPTEASLFPRMYPRENDTSYTMDYIDMPTLSELWLYHPGPPVMWEGIATALMQRFENDLWHDAPKWTGEREAELFVDKALLRLESHPDWLKLATPVLNRARPFFKGSCGVTAHGDLNFNNIFFSPSTGAIKLIDPRGDMHLPMSYELAKLHYSYATGFSAITHGLPVTQNKLDHTRTLNRMFGVNKKIRVGAACIMIAGAPLHDQFKSDEGERLFAQGLDALTREVAKP